MSKLSENEIKFIKRYIKAGLNKPVYNFLKEFNKMCSTNRPEMRNNRLVLKSESVTNFSKIPGPRAVVSGGDALFYYIDDEKSFSNFFDIKFVFNDFSDWKEYTKYYGSEDVDIFDVMKPKLDQICFFRQLFLKKFIETIVKLGSDDYDVKMDIETFLRNSFSRKLTYIYSGINSFELDDVFDISSTSNHIHEFLKAALEIINRKRTEKKEPEVVLSSNKIDLGYEILNSRSILKFIEEGNMSRLQKEYKMELENILFSTENSDANYFESYKLYYDFNLKIGEENINIRNMILDTNLWTPLHRGFDDIFSHETRVPLIDSENLRIDEIKNDFADKSILFKQIDFIEAYPDFFIVSIGFLIWDIVRLANKTYEDIIIFSRMVESAKRRVEISSSQSNILSRDRLLEQYNKKRSQHLDIVEMYDTVLFSLFDNLRCVEPFLSSSNKCVKNIFFN